MTNSTAVVAITKHGTAIARRLQEQLPDVDVYYPQKFAQGDEVAREITAFSGSVVDHVPTLFSAYSGLVGIFSLGAMVRLVAPLLRDKKTDPAIVVVDDRAEHAISVLSGHLGGANLLTQQVAKALGARPVITTASDVAQTVAVDLLGREFGFEIENFEMVTAVSAAVVNEERVHIIQEAGELDWWPYTKPLPAYLKVFNSLEAACQQTFDAALVITPRLLTKDETRRFLARGVLYRPKVIVVGVGCNRGTSAKEIEQVITHALNTVQLSTKSVRNVATIDLKADEPGLLELCARHKWPLVTYTAEQLNQISIPNPSETVFKHVGAYGVSEPAALLSSDAKDFVVEKVRSGNVTVSVCIVSHS
ncbi:cobalt-precorrin 5A hydrolase [Ferroacidibacillus organovorans]|uniref:Cobalamin biosynthesis protein CbiG n=1 Tax=Ferroacidibacillus organovorans TaxID=1765683 RepID=A0A853KDT4_9BACL|nr:cobalamin biosynthesis protein [Ferroacidibacillus organovorans]KYP79460.1 cobalamin biosynthesis protein CbiG [Ferroacidibacillus organovorans]OAG94514.1 cobalamin biosynthesis protein CbiG [Ferroacidibacillus organovorans]